MYILFRFKIYDTAYPILLLIFLSMHLIYKYIAYWKIFRHCILFLILEELFTVYTLPSHRLSAAFQTTLKGEKSKFYHLCSTDERASF